MIICSFVHAKSFCSQDENLLLIRAMRDSNVPKFLEVDLPLFYGIMKDLFPGVDVPYVDYGVLQTAIETSLDKQGFQPVPSLVSKVRFAVYLPIHSCFSWRMFVTSWSWLAPCVKNYVWHVVTVPLG